MQLKPRARALMRNVRSRTDRADVSPSICFVVACRELSDALRRCDVLHLLQRDAHQSSRESEMKPKATDVTASRELAIDLLCCCRRERCLMCSGNHISVISI